MSSITIVTAMQQRVNYYIGPLGDISKYLVQYHQQHYLLNFIHEIGAK